MESGNPLTEHDTPEPLAQEAIIASIPHPSTSIIEVSDIPLQFQNEQSTTVIKITFAVQNNCRLKDSSKAQIASNISGKCRAFSGPFHDFCGVSVRGW